MENKIFPKANVPARRVLKKQVNQMVDEKEDGFSPNIGIPQRVTGAIKLDDVLRLQHLKQELFEEDAEIKLKEDRIKKAKANKILHHEHFEIKNLNLANAAAIRRKLLLGNLANDDKDEF